MPDSRSTVNDPAETIRWALGLLPAREEDEFHAAIAALDALCRDSLDVPLSHVDALAADGVIRDYEMSANFKELRDLVDALLVARQRKDEALLSAASEIDWLICSLSVGGSGDAARLIHARRARAALVAVDKETPQSKEEK